MKFLVILGIIILGITSGGILLFLGIFFALLYYHFKNQPEPKTFEQNEYDESILKEMK